MSERATAELEITPSEAALLLGLQYPTVLRLGFVGTLEMRRAEDGRSWRISRRSVDALLAQRVPAA